VTASRVWGIAWCSGGYGRWVELGPGEPAAGPWRVEPLAVFARALAEKSAAVSGRPRIIAVDGRGGGGKTVLAEGLCRVMEKAVVVHSDEVAWGHSRFGWDDLMAEGVLGPLRAGKPVHYRPPGWDHDVRAGFLDVAAGNATVIVEGVGVGRRSLAPLADVVVWVQSDFAEAKRRGIRRDMAGLGRDPDEALRLWEEWEAEEVPFLLGDRPWERAHFIVMTAESGVMVSAPRERVE
jgi:hypothetical protein